MLPLAAERNVQSGIHGPEAGGTVGEGPTHSGTLNEGRFMAGRDLSRAERVSGIYGEFLPKPDVTRYNTALAGASYSARLGVDGLGQAFFLIPTSTAADTGGLQVFLKTSLAEGALSNGWKVDAAVAAAAAVTVDDDARTIVIGYLATTALSAIKTLVDATTTGLESRYYAGQDGTGVLAAVDETTENGHDPLDSWFLVRVDGKTFVHIGEAAPSDDQESIFIPGAAVTYRSALPKGSRIWVKRVGGTNVDGSIELWKLSA